MLTNRTRSHWCARGIRQAPGMFLAQGAELGFCIHLHRDISDAPENPRAPSPGRMGPEPAPAHRRGASGALWIFGSGGVGEGCVPGWGQQRWAALPCQAEALQGGMLSLPAFL